MAFVLAQVDSQRLNEGRVKRTKYNMYERSERRSTREQLIGGIGLLLYLATEVARVE